MIKYLSYCLMIFFVISCNHNLTDYDKIGLFLKNNNKNITNYKYLIVLNELGTCMNCNNIFSKKMGKNIDNDSLLFIVSSSGLLIDISPYLDKKEKNNIIIDSNKEFDKLNLINHSSIIKIGKQKIDTIIEINPLNIEKSDKFIQY